MKVFLSYASEQKTVAEEAHLAIRGAGHDTFFDDESLKPGANYHARIRDAVQTSDVFVFLISPHAVEPGCYALTELKYAQRKWPSPTERVIPVIVEPTPWDAIPAYLRAVTVLQPVGNKAAEIADAVERVKPQLEVAEARGEGRTSAPLQEADYLRLAEEELRSRHVPPAAIELIKRSIGVGKFLEHVVTAGTHGKTYEATIGGEQYLATPSGEYRDDQGKKCRTVRSSKRIGGRWAELPATTFVWQQGDWVGQTR